MRSPSMSLVSRLSALSHGWVPPWLLAVFVFIAIMAVGTAIQGLVTRFFATRPTQWRPFLRHAWNRTRNLVRFILALFAAAMALPVLAIPAAERGTLHHVFEALFVIQLGWIVLTIANIVMDRYLFDLKLDATDNLLARKAVTQMRIVRQAINVMLVMLTAGFALMSFDEVRQFGISLFASAGMAGIVAGLAARPLLENLLAGLQLAFTQPLRIGDAVVINNEFGTVEEIGSVYIVVKLWDLRRQIVPLSYIFTNPFVNWTRSNASVIGSVFFYFDYMLDMEELRAAAERIAQSSSLWDRNLVKTQVIDTTEQTMKVRVLLSAANSGNASDLGAVMREELIAFVRDRHPLKLPRTRQEAVTLPQEGAACAEGRDSASPGPMSH